MELRIDIQTNFSKVLADFEKFEAALKKLPDGGAALSKQLDQFSTKRFAQNVPIDAKKAEDAVNKLFLATKKLESTDTGVLSRSLSSVANSLGRYKDSILSLPGVSVLANPWTAVGAGIAYAVKTSTDFSREVSTLRALLTDIGAPFDELGFTALTEEVKRLGTESVFTSREVAMGASELAALGFTADETKKSLEGVVNLASVDPTIGLARSAEIVGSTLRQFGLDASESVRVVDILTATSVKSAASISDISESMKFLGPTAASLGVSLEDTSSIIGLLANNGLKGGNATRALSTSLVNLSAPTKQAKSAMEALNIEAFNQQGKFIGLLPFLQKYTDATKGLSDQQRNAYTSAIFGNESFQEMTVIMGALKDPTSVAGQQFSALAKSISEATGSAQTIADIKLDNLSGDIEKLKGAIDGVALSAGSASGGGLRNLTQAATALIEGFFGASTGSDGLTASITAQEAQVQLLAEAVKNGTASQIELDIATQDLNKTKEDQNAIMVEEQVETARSQATWQVWGKSLGIILRGVSGAILAFVGFVPRVMLGAVNSAITSWKFLGTAIGLVMEGIGEFVSSIMQDIPGIFKYAAAQGANYFIDGINKMISSVNGLLSSIGADKINIIPNIQVPAGPFKAAGRKISLGMEGIGLAAASAFDDGKNVAIDAANDFLDSVLDINKGISSLGSIDEAADSAESKIRARADRAKASGLNINQQKDKELAIAEKQNKDASLNNDKKTGGASGKESVKKTEDEITKVAIDAYKKRFAELEKQQDDFRAQGLVDDLRDAQKEFKKLETDIIDIYGDVPIDILNSVKNQELFTSVSEKAKKKQEEILKEQKKMTEETKKHGDEIIKTAENYEKLKKSSEDLQKKLQNAQESFTTSGKTSSDEILATSEENANKRLFDLYRQRQELQKNISSETDQAKRDELQKQLDANANYINSVSDFTDEEQSILEKANKTNEQIAQDDFIAQQKLAQEKAKVFKLTSREDLEKASKAGGETGKIADERLAKLNEIESLKQETIKADALVAEERKKLEDDVQKIRLENIASAYGEEIKQAEAVKKIYEDIAKLRASGSSFDVAGGVVRHAGGFIGGRGEVPMIARSGEYVVKAPVVQSLGKDFMDRINNSKTWSKSFGDIHVHQASSPQIARILDRYQR